MDDEGVHYHKVQAFHGGVPDGAACVDAIRLVRDADPSIACRKRRYLVTNVCDRAGLASEKGRRRERCGNTDRDPALGSQPSQHGL
eukprot:98143-Rhodomonas_salina.3